MNTIPSEAVEMVKELLPKVKNRDCDIVICPPFTHLFETARLLTGTGINLGAQNMYFEEKGAFTGEISPLMLKDLGVTYVILGHSERRQYFGETDETVNKKVISALSHGLIPIMCCGETLSQRENNETEGHLETQIREGLKGIENGDAGKIVIAYEPIWAIGTGKTASDADAQNTIRFIRSVLSEIFGEDTAETIRIQYGGSVKPSTIKGQMEMEDIDGALVGGASLNPQDFADIVNYKE